MIKISIVVPLFNKGFILSETLKSVFSQTYTNFELVIINDGSTDNSVEIVSQFEDERIKLFHQENKGAAAARNSGISKASGELIAFLDADDYWFPNHLKEIYQLYIDFPNCGLYCSRYYMKLSFQNTIKTSYLPFVSNDFKGIVTDYFTASKTYRIGLTSALAIPKKILRENFLFNPEISSGQDLELFVKIALKNNVALTDKFTVEYNFSLENQLSKTPINEKKLMDFSQFKEEEKNNKSLNYFLDLYRLEYALKYKIDGNLEKLNFYLNQINSKIPLKTRILLAIPSFILRLLLKIKHFLKRKGIDFNVYH